MLRAVRFVSHSIDNLTTTYYSTLQTCQEMRDTIDSRIVWVSVINDLLSIKPSIYSVQDINGMTAVQLREASLQMVQVERAYSSPVLPHREIELVSSDHMSWEYRQALLFPGGKQLLLLNNNGTFEIHDVDARKVILRSPVPKAEWGYGSSTAKIFPISAHIGYLVIYACGKYVFLFANLSLP